MNRKIPALLAVVLLTVAAPAVTWAVPDAYHVRLECVALRLNINDYTERRQFKVIVTVSSSDEADLNGLESTRVSVTAPDGSRVSLEPRSMNIKPIQFKAGHVKMLFKFIEDSSTSEFNTVPEGFLMQDGVFKLDLELPGSVYSGEAGFGEPVGMRVLQEGELIKNFVLKDELPFTVETTPAEFGPVYYKKQDLTNFVYQMANMDQALMGGDFHAPVENPKYVFQVRIGESDGVLNLLDPSRYIEGYQPHMIRSEQTSTPLYFKADEYHDGQVIAVDFMRQDSLEPDTMFHGWQGAEPLADTDAFSSQLIIQERVIFALVVEAPPTDEELGIIPIPKVEIDAD